MMAAGRRWRNCQQRAEAVTEQAAAPHKPRTTATALSALPPACAGRSRDYIPLYRPGRALFASLQILFSPPGASPPSVLDGSWEPESTLSFSVTMGRK